MSDIENFYTLDRYLKDGFEIKAAYSNGEWHYLIMQKNSAVVQLSYIIDIAKRDGATGLDGYRYPEMECVELSS